MTKDILVESIIKPFIAPLRKYGFQRYGYTFYHNLKRNWGLISVQKSMYQESHSTRFTINIGVASNQLLLFFANPRLNDKLKIEDCHWRIRLGKLAFAEDKWWSVENNKPSQELAHELLNPIINIAIPEIFRYLDDKALRDLWLSGLSPSLTEFQRLLFLSILLKEIGPLELLYPTIKSLKLISKGKPTEITAQIYIEKLLGQTK
jgi:hypothetical protein